LSLPYFKLGEDIDCLERFRVNVSQVNESASYEYFSILKLRVVSKSDKQLTHDEYKWFIEGRKLFKIFEMLAFARKFYDPNFSHKLIKDFSVPSMG
jgi:hypothetical protein